MLAQVKIIISSETKSPRRGPPKETKQKAMPEENVQTETPAKSQNNKKYKEKKGKSSGSEEPTDGGRENEKPRKSRQKFSRGQTVRSP